MRRLARGLALAPLAVLGACALQPDYQRPAIKVADTWTNAALAPAVPPLQASDGWWTLLNDAAVDRLVAAGLADNPTLAEAAARLEQARAELSIRDAMRGPTLSANAGAQRARDRAGAGETTASQSTASVGVGLAWELDLWRRVREGAAAARYRLTASAAEAEAARLSVVGDIVDTSLALRACDARTTLRDLDIVSRQTELAVTRARLAAGSVSPVTLATALGDLAAARTDRIAQDETCRHLVNSLSALSGLKGAEIQNLLATSRTIAAPPPFTPALPATVLLDHPTVVAAEREVAARWSDIGVARAERLPRVDLAAALSDQWIRALGDSASYGARSAGLSLNGPLLDGGAGAASVSGAEARYREAAAHLDLTVRTLARDVEDALTAQQSALARVDTSRDALSATAFALEANSARWRVGAIAQVELEASRRQYNQAQDSAVAAAADRARAWVALIRTTGAASSRKNP
uniref:efflux transporter outer membrane subunit n=1 Tax=uncultured Caulobacter sp. TaxID=158749 RepID=UPI0025DCA735|nr:efflux transporter outer membrane subunit [uncultured Caulobacter sp.]